MEREEMDRDPEPAERPPKSLVLKEHSTRDPERNFKFGSGPVNFPPPGVDFRILIRF